MQATLEAPRNVTPFQFRGVNSDGLACYDDRPTPCDPEELENLTREERLKILRSYPVCFLCKEHFDPRECWDYTSAFCCTCTVNKIVELAHDIRDGKTARDRANAVRLLQGFGQLPPRRKVRKLLVAGKRALAAMS